MKASEDIHRRLLSSQLLFNFQLQANNFYISDKYKRGFLTVCDPSEVPSHEFNCVYASALFLLSIMYETKTLEHILYGSTFPYFITKCYTFDACRLGETLYEGTGRLQNINSWKWPGLPFIPQVKTTLRRRRLCLVMAKGEGHKVRPILCLGLLTSTEF